MTDLTNDKIIEMYSDTKQAEGINKITWLNYECTIRNLSDFIGKPFVEMTKEDLNSYFANLYYIERKQSTINTHNVILRMFFKFMVREGLIKKTPLNIKVKTVMWKPKYLKESEMYSVIVSAETPMEKAAVNLLFSSGIRADECMNLKVENLDFDKGLVFVPDEIAKAGKGRNTMMSKKAIKELKDYLEHKPDTSDYIFSHDGEKYSYRSLLRLIVRCSKRVDIKMGVHTTRHTFATMFINNGGSITELAKMLGHRHNDGRINTQMTERYIEVLTNRIEDNAKHHFMDINVKV